MRDLRHAIRFLWLNKAFSATAILTLAIGIGVWPAWRASRADARAALHDGGRAHSE